MRRMGSGTGRRATGEAAVGARAGCGVVGVVTLVFLLALAGGCGGGPGPAAQEGSTPAAVERDAGVGAGDRREPEEASAEVRTDAAGGGVSVEPPRRVDAAAGPVPFPEPTGAAFAVPRGDVGAEGPGDGPSDEVAVGPGTRVPPDLPAEPGEDLRVEIDLRFDVGSAAVDPPERRAVATLADLLEEYPRLTAVIEGHADSRGSAAGNRALSRRRAEAVVRLLTEEYGIEASRLTAVGRGAERPVASNATPEGRAHNRRVSAVLAGR